MGTALARAGRKRKANVRRDATTGRSRGEIVDLTVVLNQPHRRAAKNPKDERLGYALGRLQLEGSISEDQLNAGNAWAALVHAYARMIGIPSGSPRSSALTASVANGFYAWEGETIEIDPTESERRRKALKARYDRCHDTLHEAGRSLGVGAELLKAVRHVCIDERFPDERILGNLRIGLNALHRILRTN